MAPAPTPNPPRPVSQPTVAGAATDPQIGDEAVGAHRTTPEASAQMLGQERGGTIQTVIRTMTRVQARVYPGGRPQAGGGRRRP